MTTKIFLRIGKASGVELELKNNEKKIVELLDINLQKIIQEFNRMFIESRADETLSNRNILED